MLLLLFAWGVSFLFLAFPPGDPDFSQVMYWYEDFMEADDYMKFYETNPFDKAFTGDNLLYLISLAGYFTFMFLVGLFYFVLYECDLRKVPLSKAPAIFFTRIWWLILYSACVCIPSLMIMGGLPVLFLFLIPSFYLRSGLVFFEKQDAFSATLMSSIRSKGHRLSIFVDLSVILLIYILLHLVVVFALHAESKGLYLVESFLRAYFLLAIFRNMGSRYHMVTLLNKE